MAGLQHFATDPGQTDPHFWHDPLKLAAVADAVARDLSRIDPAHATSYEQNATALRLELERLDHDYATGLADCARHTIVTSHDAFGYLARYGIDVAAITGLAPGAEPTPADLSHLQDLIRNEGITTVFSETLASPAAADALAHDMGVRSEVLDPIEGLSDATAGQTYLTLMRRNLSGAGGGERMHDLNPVELTNGSVTIGGRPILRGVDVTVEPGQFVALMGANGSGKSTLVRALVGLWPLSAGELRLFGTPIAEYDEWSRLGFVPQRASAESGVPASVWEVVASGRLTQRGCSARCRDPTAPPSTRRSRWSGSQEQGTRPHLLACRAGSSSAR